MQSFASLTKMRKLIHTYPMFDEKRLGNDNKKDIFTII